MKKNIVIIGGGSASAGLLKGLVKYRDKYNLTVVGSIADNGGSNGRLQGSLSVTGLGALRKCLLSLSEADKELKDAFGYRFEQGELAGHAMGNIFMAALEKTSGSAESALANSHKILKVNGRVIPTSFEKVTLFAELENGETIEGETNIDIPKHDGNLKIKRIFLKPTPKADTNAVEEIKNADLIIIGPGDLYTTTLPNFSVSGISEAVKGSKARKTLVVNSWNKFGETNGFSVEDFTSEVEKYLGVRLDKVIYNSGVPSEEKLNVFKKENPEVVNLVKASKILDEKKFIGKDLLLEEKPTFDVEKLVEAIISTLNIS